MDQRNTQTPDCKDSISKQCRNFEISGNNLQYGNKAGINLQKSSAISVGSWQREKLHVVMPVTNHFSIRQNMK